MRCLFYLFIYLTNIIPLFEYAQNQEISNGSIILKPYIIIFYLFILFFYYTNFGLYSPTCERLQVGQLPSQRLNLGVHAQQRRRILLCQLTQLGQHPRHPPRPPWLSLGPKG
jgi:hypothetical protein